MSSLDKIIVLILVTPFLGAILAFMAGEKERILEVAGTIFVIGLIMWPMIIGFWDD